jgi:hypothetical protein
MKEQQDCKCKGCIHPGAMCGWVVIMTSKCGAPEDHPCEHKVGWDRGGQRNQNNEGDLVCN